MDTIEDVIDLYIAVSVLARQGGPAQWRPELNDMLIDHTSLAPLAAFPRALNEDYS